MRRAILVGIGFTVGCVLFAGALALPATADPQGGSPSTPGSTVIITPILEAMVFGDTVGLPLGCNAGASVLSTASPSLSPSASQIVQICTSLSDQGAMMLEEGIVESSSLSILNPLFNPLLEASASQLQTIGTNDAALLGIFGPTIVSSGETVGFFEGS